MKRNGAVFLRENLSLVERTVGDDCDPHTFITQTLQCDLGNVSCTQHHRSSPLERSENFLRELHCGRAHRGCTPADAGLLANPRRDKLRVLKQSIECRARCFARALPCVLNLALYLRLAEDHRVEPGSDAEEMRRCVAIVAKVEILRAVFAEPVREQLAHSGD